MGGIMYLRVPGSEFQVQGLKDSVKTAHGTRQLSLSREKKRRASSYAEASEDRESSESVRKIRSNR
jgi:hypothetical protein